MGVVCGLYSHAARPAGVGFPPVTICPITLWAKVKGFFRFFLDVRLLDVGRPGDGVLSKSERVLSGGIDGAPVR